MHFQKATESLHIYDKINSYFQGITHAALSHEFTHFVEELSAEKFRKFTDILFDVLGKNDVDVNRLIEAKEAVLRNTEEYKGRSEKDLRAIAYSEAVAEMMEPVLTDTDAISRISQKIKQQDKSLWGKIKDFIKGIVEKLKAAYRDMEPDSAIARLTRETVTNSEAVLDAFSEAAADAVLNYNLQEGQKNNAREGVQFMSRNSNDSEIVSIKQQIAEAKDELAQMQSIANVAVQDLSKMTQKQRYDWAVNELKRTGYKVDRPNFGVIEFTPKQINTGMNYLRSAEDIAAFAVLPKVLKQGNIIFENSNHKGRQFATFTISAPVTINGTTGYMAVVVQETSSRHYHTHRIVLPDGSAFKFEMQHSDPSGGFAQNSTRLATNTNAASNDRVAQPNAEVKGNFLKSSRDTSEMTYAEILAEQNALRARQKQVEAKKNEAMNNPELLSAMDSYTEMFSELRDLLGKKHRGEASDADIERISEIKNSREETLKKIAKIQDDLGLNGITEEKAELRSMEATLRKAADSAWARECAQKENKAIEKSGLSAPEYFRRKALRAFKTTRNFNETGYLLPDGKMLDFSGGERNHRYRDHREIGEIYEATQGTNALNRFLNDGNIRIMAESPGVDISANVEPTAEQYAAIRKFVMSHGTDKGEFFVDFSNSDGRNVGNYSYNRNVSPERVLNDIKYFYENGETRKQSEVAEFLYSSRTASDSEYLNLAQDPEKNREALSRMVEQAAREAGYTRLFFHGSKKGGGFTVFRDWQYFTENREYAKRYANRENPGSLYETYVKMENPFDTRIPEVRELFEQARQEYGMGELQENGLPDWTDGYDIADYIDENDLPYDGIILDEGGDMVNGKPVSRGLSYVIRDSSQVKSADAVTYDDNGNVIPLSQRFDMGKEDIRYSARNPQDQAEAENERLKSDVQSQIAEAVREYRRQQDVQSKAYRQMYERQMEEVKKSYQKQISTMESEYSADLAQIQDAFFQTVEAYEKGQFRNEHLEKALKQAMEAQRTQTKASEADNATWEKEFNRLLKAYEASGRNAQRLKQTVEAQRARAKAKVEAARVTEQRGKLYRAVNEINRRLLNPTKTLYVPDSLAPAVTKFMQGLTEAMESPKNSWNVQGALETLQGQYQKLTQMNEGVFTQEYNQGILDLLDNAINAVGGTDFNKLSASQIEDVYSAVRSVLTAIRNENKMFAANLNKTYAEAAAAVRREESGLPNRKPTTGAVQDKAEKFGWNQLKPVYAMMRLGSDTLLKQYNNLRAGEDKWQRVIAAARAYGLGTMAKYNYDQWDDSLMKLDTETGTVELSLQERMSLYAYARREQAFEHLTKGGFVLSDKNTRTVKNRLGIETEQI